MIREMLNMYNSAIAEMGYPNAGYKYWIITKDTCEFQYMFEGFLPDQETYTKIHGQELFKDARENRETNLDGLAPVSYYRFKETK